MTRKHISFLIVYGSEVKAFIHSGLIKRLSEKYNVSIITTHPESAVFDAVDYVPIYQMPIVSENRWLAKLRKWSSRSQKALLRKKGLSTWRPMISPETPSRLPMYKRLWRSMQDTPIWYSVLPVFERQIARFLGDQPVWHKLFDDLSPDCLVVSPLKGETILPAIQTAQIMQVKVVGTPLSWKDVFVSSYISVIPDKIVMPTRTSADYMLAVNPHISPEVASISTSLHFERILNPEDILPRQEFCQLAGLDWERPYICYTAGSPLAVSGEIDVITEWLSRMTQLHSSPQVLLRINPMDDGRQYLSLQEKYPDILVLQKPNWEWLPEEDWFAALADDMVLWVNTICHSACNVSIPSTVTIEFAAFKKPVVNICFDLDMQVAEDRSIKRFWDAPFYNEVRQSGYVVPTFSIDELLVAVQRIMATSYEASSFLFFSSQTPVEDVINQIESVLHSFDLSRRDT